MNLNLKSCNQDEEINGNLTAQCSAWY